MSGQPESGTLTQSEAARRLGLSVKTIRRMLDRGDLTAVASGQRGGALRVLQDRKLDTFLSDSPSTESDTPIAKSDTHSARTAGTTGAEPQQPANRTSPRAGSAGAYAAPKSPRALVREEPPTPVSPADSAAPMPLAPEPAQELPDEDWVRLDPSAHRDSGEQTFARPRRAHRAPIAILVSVVLVAGVVTAFALHNGSNDGPVTSPAGKQPLSTQTTGSGAIDATPSSPNQARPQARGGAASTVRGSQASTVQDSNHAPTITPAPKTPVAPAHPSGCDPVLRAEGLC